MATNLPSWFLIQFLEQLLKFLVNFTLLKYVKSQRSYGLLITKELTFGFQILDLKDHFSASLNVWKSLQKIKAISLISSSVLKTELGVLTLQFGFKNGTGCIDASFLINEAVDHFVERSLPVFWMSVRHLIQYG